MKRLKDVIFCLFIGAMLFKEYYYDLSGFYFWTVIILLGCILDWYSKKKSLS